MSILSATALGHAHGDFDVFTNITLSIPNDARIGLVGPNGIGKTTLLRILAGIHAPTSGTVHRARDSRIGYLRQEAVEAFAGREHSIYAEMLTVFAAVHARMDELARLEALMAAGDHSESMVARYGVAQEGFERAGGYDYEVRIAKVLEGLGFPRAQWETSLNHLSGGQKTRVLLAKQLLEQPDLLILDEPTNHLDIQAVEWLENTLRSWKGAFLVVSHDRYFLDNVADRIWEMNRTRMETYRGNYSAYVRQRQERWERQHQVYEEEKERLEKELEFIRRNMAGQRSTMAKGKLRRLSRELVAISELGLEGVQGKSWSETGIGGVSVMGVEEAARRIREIPAPSSRPPVLTMHLRTGGRSGNIVLRTKTLQVGYPGNPLFVADNIDLQRQDCAALIGPNGAGKTTFLRTIMGQIQPLAGEVKLGASLQVGYFAQAHDALDLDNTVIDELIRHREMTPGEARDYLARYLFRGDDVWKRVRALSGGERGRLALAILALQGANFLLLDEPTNHLDIPAQEVLQEGLERFDGTLLLVSHDRYLVDRLATQIWEVQDGRLRVFNGTYSELLAAREREKSQPMPAPVEVKTPALNGAQRVNTTSSSRESRKRLQAVNTIEVQIAELERRLALCEAQLQAESEVQNYEVVGRLATEHQLMRDELDGMLARWESLATE